MSLEGWESRTLSQGAVCSVTNVSKSPGFACPRCKTPMDEVVRIAPLVSEPGLIGYECPACCYVTSVVLQSEGSQKRRCIASRPRTARFLRPKTDGTYDPVLVIPLRSLHKPSPPTVLDYSCALAQGDWCLGPALTCGQVRCLRNLKVLDAGQVLYDVLVSGAFFARA